MKTFTTGRKINNFTQNALVVCFWICVLQFASMILKQEMILPSPILVFNKLVELLQTLSFYKSLAFSFSRVVYGFISAFLSGIICAIFAYKYSAVNILLRPLLSAIKATPVASYIVLCLLLFSSKTLSITISFIMVFPIIYANTLQGFQAIDKEILEMARIFNISKWQQALFIYSSQLFPFLISACSISLGMAWKAGIAAEVIGLPLGSIGEQLYQAKITIDTANLLAWTIVIIAVSFVFEAIFISFIKCIFNALEKV